MRTLYCSEHTVTWGRSDQTKESKFKEKAVFSYDGNMTFTLTIPRVEKSDRGEYFCRADNQLAPGRSDTKTAELKVNCKENSFKKKIFFTKTPLHSSS